MLKSHIGPLLFLKKDLSKKKDGHALLMAPTKKGWKKFVKFHVVKKCQMDFLTIEKRKKKSKWLKRWFNIVPMHI